MKEVTFRTAYKGLGTEFSESEQPPEFARRLENRFINIYGAVEIRPGLGQIDSPGTNFFSNGSYTIISGNCDLITEYSNPVNGDSILLSSLITSTSVRAFFRYSTTVNAWTEVLPPPNPNTAGNGLSRIYVDDNAVKEGKLFSSQFSEKMIFAGEQYRPFFYSNNSESLDRFFDLNPVVIEGFAASGSNSAKLTDDNVSNWLTETFVQPNDLVYNVTRSAFGIITSVGAGNIDCSPITSAGGTSGAGKTIVTAGASESMIPGDLYQIWDTRELNIFPQGGTESGITGVFIDIKDNTAVAGAQTTSAQISVSGFDFSTSDIRRGDVVYNTTRNRVAFVNSVSANLSIVESTSTTVSGKTISGQTAGDSLVFLKTAAPISVFPHIHYGRLYLIDERERTKIRVTGPDDAQDFTTFDDSLDAGGIDYGAKQPQGEELLTLSTFQKYLVVGGKRNIYLSEGTDPIADTSGATVSFTPVGLFSQGCVSNLSLANIGSNMLFAANDGMRSFNILDVLQVQTDNISEVIKTELRQAIKSNLDTPQNLQVIHYPKRNWVMFKVGSVIYNYNYTPIYIEGQLVSSGTWSKFTGTFAECNAFLVKRNGDLLCSFHDVSADVSYFYEFDVGYYTDASAGISTQYRSAWLIPSGDGIVSDGRYIKPFFENEGEVSYNIVATSDLETQLECDNILVTATGGPVLGNYQVGVDPIGGELVPTDRKYPLRWRGEQVQVDINTSAQQTRDQISKYVMYVNTFGRN
jgi:hypothetical protein